MPQLGPLSWFFGALMILIVIMMFFSPGLNSISPMFLKTNVEKNISMSFKW